MLVSTVSQLKMLQSTLRRVLAFAKVNPIFPRKPVLGRLRTDSEKTRRVTRKKL
jgi:hypothetical protein